MRKIIHQQQSTATSCTSACLAMILNLPTEKLMRDFHDGYKNMEYRPYEFLCHYFKQGINSIRRCYSDEWIDGTKKHVYLGIVPSLNLEAITHSVVFDCRDGLIIYDPNKGKPSKKYYSFNPEEVKNNPLAIQLKGYQLEVEFIL